MSTKEEIDVSYGVNNDFFRLWLDKSMTYSCALFQRQHDNEAETDTETETLEQAQCNKHAFLCRAASVTANSRVLDIGCGWGANLAYLSDIMQVKQAVGITLSKDQYAEILLRNIPNVQAEYVDYRHYQPSQLFDAVISIGMFEHIATPQQTRRGEHRAVFRDYFRRVWEWTRPGAAFGLQTVVGARVPRGVALQEIAWVTSTIFPGAISPRLEAIFETLLPYWEVMELQMRREHYAKTTAEWLRRMESNEGIIRDKYGNRVFDDYRRYLKACVMAFEDGYQSLAQFSLRRIDR